MPISRNQHFDPNTIPNEPSDYIAAVERAVSGIRPSNGKELVWRNEDREKTGWSVVCLHGFSASRRELAPMSEKIAELLDANLVLILLTDHGIDGGAMARATSLDWLNNSVEAITVGQRIGEKVLVTGVSTGPALATWAHQSPHGSARPYDSLPPASARVQRCEDETRQRGGARPEWPGHWASTRRPVPLRRRLRLGANTTASPLTW